MGRCDKCEKIVRDMTPDEAVAAAFAIVMLTPLAMILAMTGGLKDG